MTIFFWKVGEFPYGSFSQWHPSTFTDKDGNQFTCCEQYMMYHKAILFKDYESAKRILEERSPSKMKQLGRQVKHFDATAWDKEKVRIVEEGNMYKFSQNKDLLELLLSTKDAELVEASPLDRIWGIGYSAEKAMTTSREMWGENLLG